MKNLIEAFASFGLLFLLVSAVAGGGEKDGTYRWVAEPGCYKCGGSGIVKVYTSTHTSEYKCTCRKKYPISLPPAESGLASKYTQHESYGGQSQGVQPYESYGGQSQGVQPYDSYGGQSQGAQPWDSNGGGFR